jgi:hypothetical protein
MVKETREPPASLALASSVKRYSVVRLVASRGPATQPGRLVGAHRVLDFLAKAKPSRSLTGARTITVVDAETVVPVVMSRAVGSPAITAAAHTFQSGEQVSHHCALPAFRALAEVSRVHL